MQLSRISVLPLLLFLILAFVSCDTEDPFQFDPPDFSTVPQPYDTTSTESVTIGEGVKAYIHDEGYGEFQVTLRDQLSLFLTLRTESGEIIYSSFSSDRVNPVLVTMSVADGKRVSVHQTINNTPGFYTVLLTYTPGFREGLLGMQVGEKRTLVVEPEKGYKNIPQNSGNVDYTDSTLIYDIQISSISPTKSQ